MKYRQPGYRDAEFKADRQRERKGEQTERDAARKVRHAMQRTASVVMRCADCGNQNAEEIELTFESTCPKCKAALHNCRNCRYFDTQARFECRQPIPERIASKTAANRCELYEARAVLDATGRRVKTATENPRSAFDRLFKK